MVGNTIPELELLYGVGLKPMMPEHEAGALMLPPISVPKANGTHFDATNAPSPPELPPHVLV